jgi:hypothetical protein
MTYRFVRAALTAALLLPVTAWSADTIPVEAFARHQELSNPQLSPDGKYLAVRMDENDTGNHALVVFNVDDMQKPLSMLRMPKYEIPLGITWVSPTRLVVAKGRQQGSLDKPAFYGELLATDANGKNQDYIYGYEGTLGRRAGNRAVDRGWGWVVGTPEIANGHFYMKTETWNNEGHYSLYDVDATKNARHLIGDIDVDGMSFMIGADGLAHFAYGDDNGFNYVVYHRERSGWRQLDSSDTGQTFYPLTYTPGGEGIYASYSADGGPTELVEQAENGSNRTVLAKDDFASIGYIQWTPAPSCRQAAHGAQQGISRQLRQLHPLQRRRQGTAVLGQQRP